MAVLFGIALLASPAEILAQSLDTGTAPASIADALKNAKPQRIVVFDFLNSDGSLTQLGESFSDEFSRVLAESNPDLQVVDRRVIRELLQQNRVAPTIVHNTEAATWLASRLIADTFVIGKVDLKNDSLLISIEAIRVKDGKKIANFKESLPLSDFARSLAATSISWDHSKEFPNPKGDKSHMAKCIRCPNPSFSEEAISSTRSGSLKLSAWIGEDGLPSEINIISIPPPGFVQKSIETIQKWTFQPATDADGKPKGVWVPIEITWRIY
jgi:hypothetical protein